MRFEWDEKKNQFNIGKHGFNFTNAWEIFEFPMVVNLDNREDYEEDRWIGIGVLRDRVVAIVVTEPDENTIRVISLRKALKHERRQYEQFLRNQLGED